MKKTSPFRRSKGLLLVGMLALSVHGISQNPSTKVFQDWSTTSATQNNFQRSIVRSKSLGGAIYYYTAGSTVNGSGNYDLFVQKKNSSGTILWTQTYNGAGNGNDYASDVQIDAVGNVYICGTYYKDATDSNNAVIIKYNTAGTHKWTKTYNGAGSRHDAFAALQVGGNVVVAVGTTWKGSTNKYDMVAIRCDSSGNQVWVQTWDYLNLNDVAVNLWNNGTKIYIAGGAQSATTTYKYAVVNVKASDGSIQGSTVTGGTAFGFDQLTDMQMDVNGNIYLTGGVLDVSSGYDIKTVKLDSALNILWSQTYTSSGTNIDIGTGIALDQLGNVIVTGYRTSSTSGQDYVTIKYSSGGVQRWVSTYDGGFNAQDSATAIVVSQTDTNKIYVTGFSHNGSSKDYLTMRYDGQGNMKWEIAFNNFHNTDDRATAIALDDQGNIIVAGQNKLAWNSHTYTTVRYVERRTTMHKDTISHTSTSFVFTENRDQLLGTDSVEHPEVKFYTQSGYPSVYFQDTAVSFVFAKLDTSHAFEDTLTRVDMKFKNRSANEPKIYSLEECSDHSNFFYPHIPEGRCRVQNYKELVTFNVWDSVDVIYGSNPGGLKYYFVCKPLGGGNSASQIDLVFEGSDSVHIGASGELMIYTKQGIIVQRKAQVWQIDGSGNFSALAWQPSYNKIGTREVKFTSFGSFNSSLPLVISMDWGPAPILQHIAQPEWSMYLGGAGYDEGTAISFDTDGNPYFAGYTESAVFPHVVGFGAYTYGLGMFDAYIAKFGSADGASTGIVNDADRHIWTTYYGGSENDIAYGVTSVGNGTSGSTYITGVTGSGDMPVFNNGGTYYQTTLKGYYDAFVVRVDNQYGGFALSQNATLWATYFGGNGDECGYAITSDPSGNIFIGGRTSTSAYSSSACVVPTDNGLPKCTTVVAYNNGGSYGGGASDGLIVQFDNTGTLQWSTFYGGENADTIFDIAVASTDIYVTGSTEGGSVFPITANPAGGSYNQSTYGGGATDAFLTHFKSGVHNWCTYFGGDDVDRSLAIAINSDVDIFIAGVTASANPACAPACLCDVPSTGDFPMCDAFGSYFQGSLGVGAHGGLSDGFFARFSSTGALVWSTYYGGEGDDKINDLDVSYLDEIYFAGHTNTALDVTAIEQAGPNAYDYLQGSFNGGTDATLGYFDSGNQRGWSTWYAHYLYVTDQECGNAIGVRSTGPYNHYWYMTGYTNTVYDQPNGTGFLTEAANASNECCPNSYVQTYIGGDYDAFVTRFSMYDMFMISVEETEQTSNLDANVFPNPSSQMVNVQMNLEQTTDVNILIYSITGELVYSQKYGSQSGSFTTQIDFSGFAGGVYMLEVQTEDACATKRVIKQ